MARVRKSNFLFPDKFTIYLQINCFLFNIFPYYYIVVLGSNCLTLRGGYPVKKKIIFSVLLFAVLTLFTTACSVQTGTERNKTGSQPNPQQEQLQKEQQEEETDNHDTAQEEILAAGNEITVIAKSGSESPDDEKEAVLNEIARELDEIIKSIDALEQADDNEFK